MQNNHASETTRTPFVVVFRRGVAVVLGLISAALLVGLGIGANSIADTYGNITEGGFSGIALILGVLAAAVGALAAAFWSRSESGKLVLKVFLWVLVAAAIIFGVVYMMSDKVIIG